jgi:hypothetical protein
VCARPAWDMADEQAGVRVAFDDHVEGSHAARITRQPVPAQRSRNCQRRVGAIRSVLKRETPGGTAGGTPPPHEVFPLAGICGRRRFRPRQARGT